MTTLRQVLSRISDHRGRSGRLYRLESIVMLVLLGFMCGRNTLAGVARLAKDLSPLQREALGLSRWRMPSHPTLCIFFHSMDTVSLQTALSFAATGGVPPEVMALDGKRLCGSRSDEHPNGTHMLSCFADALKAVVGQTPQPEGGNEITAALALLQPLELQDAVITGDAMFTNRSLCDTIAGKGGGFVFTVKDNQPTLKSRIESATAAAEASLSPSRVPDRRRREPA
jgi:hypothetical protein